MMAAASLRAAVSMVGPLLPSVTRTYGLSSAEAGLLTALPVMAFASVSLCAPRLVRRSRGMARAVLLAMMALAIGITTRSMPWIGALYLGTVVLSAGIATGNVLLPAIVKELLPRRQGLVTASYATAMNLPAALASGFAVPLAAALPGGWRASLAITAPIAVLGVAAWIPLAEKRIAAPLGPPARPLPWRSRAAWQVTAYMGLQSFGAYILLGWLPLLLEDHGTSPVTAGWELFEYQAAALVSSVGLAAILDRVGDYRAFACGAACFLTAGYFGLLVNPDLALIWTMIVGWGAGGAFVLALTFMGLRAGAPDQTAGLSAMAQGLGYGLAALGPLLFGALHAASGSWAPSMLMLVGSAGLLVVAGFYAAPPPPVRDNNGSPGCTSEAQTA